MKPKTNTVQQVKQFEHYRKGPKHILKGIKAIGRFV
jgi:hypothetical protein